MIKLEDKVILFNHYNDGSCRVQIDLLPSWNTVPTITWLYERDEELLYLVYLVEHLRAHFYDKIILHMPYIINGRMDRTKNTNDVFTLKYSCNIINSLHFYEITTYDPHSPVSVALLDKIYVENPSKEIQSLLDMYPDATMCFPDEGSMKRLHPYFEVPYCFFVKERNWETQKIESVRLAGERNMIAGHDILLCDDILSRGSTVYAAAKQLKERGAKNIYVWVSHCENTVLRPNLNGQSLLDIPDLITKVYTTNSIFTKNHPKVEIIKRF
jgi:ribose-phosphate pyrophosphokinase